MSLESRPPCATGLYCGHTVVPWSAENDPDRVSIVVFQGHPGVPAAYSPTILTSGAEQCLDGASYHLALGDSPERSYFVTQFRSRGRWFRYDCLQAGTASCSNVFCPDWDGPPSLGWFLCIVTPTTYDADTTHRSSPSGRTQYRGNFPPPAHPDSPSARLHRR